MNKWGFWLSRLAEFIWNKTIFLQHPVKYRLKHVGTHRVVTQWLKVGDRDAKFIFSSQQISYIRKGSHFVSGRKVRLYRVVVIEETLEVDMKTTGYPSQVYFIPELCSGVFRHTLIPHSCAINFIIHKMIES